MAELAESIDLTKPYRSPVSAGPFQVKEKTLWLGITVFLMILLGLNLALSVGRRPFEKNT